MPDEIRASDLFEIIRTTRSMRRLKPDPVPNELIRKILEAGFVRRDSPRDGSCAHGDYIGDAAGAPACTGFNAPPRNEGTSSVGNDRNHRQPA